MSEKLNRGNVLRIRLACRITQCGINPVRSLDDLESTIRRRYKSGVGLGEFLEELSDRPASDQLCYHRTI